MVISRAKTRTLVLSALLAALSILCGKYFAFNTGFLRISFENLPVILAGILFGPMTGAAVGAVADLLGCVMLGYSINPIITVGAASIGFVAGWVWRLGDRRTPNIRLAFTVAFAHLTGSIIIKSIGLYVFYHFAVSLLLLRIPNYILVGGLEFVVLRLLLSNQAFRQEMGERFNDL